MYLFKLIDNNSEYLVRENLEDKKKVYFVDKSCDKKSLGSFRVLATSPFNYKKIINMIQKRTSSYMLSGYFSKNIKRKFNEFISKVPNENMWIKIREFIEAVIYYTNDSKNVYNLDMDLSKFTVSNKYIKDNLFYDYKICNVIPDDDIAVLSDKLSLKEIEFINILLENNLSAGDNYFIDDGDELSEQSYLLLNKIEDEKVALLWEGIAKLSNKIKVEYSKIESKKYTLIREILKYENHLSDESYTNFCRACLKDENIWCERSNITSDIILRAYNGDGRNKNEYFKNNIEIDIAYIVSENIEKLVKKIIEENQISRICVTNELGEFDKLDSGSIQAFFPQEETKLIAYCGKMSEDFIKDSNVNIFLRKDSTTPYYESLKKYFNVKEKFSKIKIEAANQIAKINKKVYENILRRYEQDHDGGYNGVYIKYMQEEFKSLHNEEFINLLTYFRSHSYGEGAGNASKNNETEIEKDYSKEPWKFVYEFIQNVDDCMYDIGVTPKIEIQLDKESKSISFEYNELGFLRKDILAITQFGNSDKSNRLEDEPDEDGVFDRECTGRKGRGFKSVFVMPGKDIVVHVRSNGYAFKFVKSVGQIIPIWEDDVSIPKKGTKIIIKGIEKLGEIYERIQNIFSIIKENELFAKCPILFLRKLKDVTVVDKKQGSFSVKIEKIKSEYGQTIDINNAKVISGIKYRGAYVNDVLTDLKVILCNNNKVECVNAKQLSMMFLSNERYQIASIIAPVMLENKQVFSSGALYRTLPLDENTYSVPLAINAPFVVDSGRKKIEEKDITINTLWINNVFDIMLPKLYDHIKRIDEINIQRYYSANEHNTLFDEQSYKLMKSIKINDIIRRFPILLAYGEAGYVSAEKAVVLPKECYLWENCQELKKVFCDRNDVILVEEKYLGKGLKLNQIKLITSDFCDNMTKYLNTVSNDKIKYLLEYCVYPYIIKNYEKIIKEINNKSKLAHIKMFLFIMYDGQIIREAISDKLIYLSGLPKDKRSIGQYRTFGNEQIVYSDDMMVMLTKLEVKIKNTSEVFSANKISNVNLDSWKDASDLISAIIYYEQDLTAKISYFRKCVLPASYSPDNIFRTAYNELSNSDILHHVITEDEILEIALRMDNYVNRSNIVDDVIDTIKKLGCNMGDDFFDTKDKSVQLNSWTRSLIEYYCNTREHSNIVVNKIIDNYLVNKINEKHLIIDYKDIKNASNEFFAALFACEKIEEGIRCKIAKQFVDDNCKESTGIAYKEAFVRSLALLNNVNISDRKKLSFKLSEILDRRLGDVLNKLNIEFKIEEDCPVEKYESKEANRAIEWLEDNKTDNTSYRYVFYALDLTDGFISNDSKERYLASEDKAIYLDKADTEGALLECVKNMYNAANDLYGGYIEIIQIQNRLKSEWRSSKKEYINELEKFRRICKKYEKVLCPNVQEDINHATDNALKYLVPELLQNINDCKKTRNERVLRISLDTKKAIMILQYEEKGFDYSNVYSITALGQSSKHDASEGEKGLGFKKVFTLFDEVEIYSNGFNFKLEKKGNTVPIYIKDNKYNFPQGTTMVFKTENKFGFEKIVEAWEELYSNSVGVVSPIFLKNIDKYVLTVDNEKSKILTRQEIEEKYIIREYNILEEYEGIFDKYNYDWEEEINEIKKDLRNRRKCDFEAMTDEVFDNYIKGLSISVAILRSGSKERERGYFYSTLSTNDLTNLSLHINLPIELSTGRDTILNDSIYNERLFKIVFGNKNTYYGSIFYHILETLHREGVSIFNYIHHDITKFVEYITKFTKETPEFNYSVLNNLLLFKRLSDGKEISLKQGYTVEDIMYQYVKNVEGITVSDFEEWLHNNIEESSGYDLIDYHNKNMLDSINSFAKSIESSMDKRFPLTALNDVLRYFADEYGGENNAK